MSRGGGKGGEIRDRGKEMSCAVGRQPCEEGVMGSCKQERCVGA